MNLLDLVKEQLTPDLVQKASTLVGEDSAKTSSALGAIAPTLLSAVAAKGSSKAGADEILATLSDNKVDDSLLGNVGGMLGAGGGADNPLLKIGGALLPMLLGNKTAGVAGLIASLFGIKSGTASMLLSLAAPIIGSLISKQVKTGGLDASGLASMLGSQRGALAAAAPKGLDAVLGLGDVASGISSAASSTIDAGASAARTATSAASSAVNAGADVVRDAGRTASAVANQTVKTGNSMLRWLLPLLAILAIGLLLWNFLGGSAPDLKSVACTNLNTVQTTINSGLPTITADTKAADVKGWFDKVKPVVTTLLTAARAASIDVSGLETAYKTVETAITAITGDTVGTAADTLNTAITGLKTAGDSVKSAAGCS
jgi:hypothetical protein